MDWRVQPARVSTPGLVVSNDHSCAAPPSSGCTRTHRMTCGLVHWNVLTVPLKVKVLVGSYIANEWCADAGSAPPSKAATTIAQAWFSHSRFISIPIPRELHCETGRGRISHCHPCQI